MSNINDDVKKEIKDLMDSFFSAKEDLSTSHEEYSEFHEGGSEDEDLSFFECEKIAQELYAVVEECEERFAKITSKIVELSKVSPGHEKYIRSFEGSHIYLKFSLDKYL